MPSVRAMSTTCSPLACIVSRAALIPRSTLNSSLCWHQYVSRRVPTCFTIPQSLHGVASRGSFHSGCLLVFCPDHMPGFIPVGLSLCRGIRVRTICHDPSNTACNVKMSSKQVTGARAAFKAAGKPMPPLRYTCVNRIPYARGMGSSSAAIIAGLIGGLVLAGHQLPMWGHEELLQLACEIEASLVNMIVSGAMSVRFCGWGNERLNGSVYHALALCVQERTCVRYYRWCVLSCSDLCWPSFANWTSPMRCYCSRAQGGKKDCRGLHLLTALLTGPLGDSHAALVWVILYQGVFNHAAVVL